VAQELSLLVFPEMYYQDMHCMSRLVYRI